MSAPAAVEERPAAVAAADLSLGSTAALLLGARALQYISFGLIGVIVARGLGPDGRGVYGLINETAMVAAAFPGMGLEMAGIYLMGQRRFSLQTVFSNSFSWAIALWTVCAALIAAALLTGEDILGMTAGNLAVALAGACLITLTDGAAEYLMPLGRVWAYTALKVMVPVLRLIGIAAVALAAGLSVEAAAGLWLASIGIGAAVTVFFLSQHVRLLPRISLRALRAQASFGVRGHFGWILQALNHRLDIFLVGFFVGTAGVGEYLVGVNLAELAWWVPLALGTVLFPKVSAMDTRGNFETSAAACRRTLAVTALATVGLLIAARPLIPVVYGTEFAAAATVFVILLPSGLLYTVHKALGASLAANGMPQATIFSGLISLPATIGLNLVLVPAWGINGAAFASNVAYLINAAVVLFIFLRVSRMRVRDVLVFNAEDWAAFRWTAREIWTTRLRRSAAYRPAATD